MVAAKLPRTNRALNARARALATEYDTAMRAQTKTRTRQIAEDAKSRLDAVGIVQDDGAAPAAPTGLTVTAQRRGAFAEWSMPPEADHVARTEVRVLRASDGAEVRLLSTTARTIRLDDLEPGVACDVSARHVDMWKRTSPWSAAVRVTPALSVADEVDLAGLAMLGRLKGLLPNANLATIADAAKLGDQVVLARAMATQDAAAINLWVQSAAIQSAKIASLAADKIDAGILTASVSISSTGRIEASGARMDANGVTLTEVADMNSPPNVGAGSKVTPQVASPWAAMQFFNSSTSGRRGIGLWADGNSAGREGSIRLIATDGDQKVAAAKTAIVALQSAPDGGQVNISTDAFVSRNLTCAGAFRSNGPATVDGRLLIGGSLEFLGSLISQFALGSTSLGAGQFTSVLHGLGTVPKIVLAQFTPPNDSFWYPIAAGTNSNGLEVKVSADRLTIINNRSDTVSVRCQLFK